MNGFHNDFTENIFLSVVSVVRRRVIASLVMTQYCCLLAAQVPENRAGFEREYS